MKRETSTERAKKPTMERRKSNVTDEDREHALKVRKNALRDGNGDYFLLSRAVLPIRMLILMR